MRKLKRLMSFLLVGSALVAVVVLSEANLEVPEVYGNGFCLLEGGSRSCNVQTLALCLAGMQSADSKCVRQTLKEKTESTLR